MKLFGLLNTIYTLLKILPVVFLTMNLFSLHHWRQTELFRLYTIDILLSGMNLDSESR
jgi:hypothetical protein